MKIKKAYKDINNNSRDDCIKKDEDKKLRKKKEIADEYISTDNKRFNNRSLIFTTNNKIIDINNPKKKYKIKEKNKFLNEIKYNEIYNQENFEFMKLGNEFNLIGRGAYSEVLLAKNTKDQMLYAIKKIKNRQKNKENNNQLPSEILIHTRIIHENIIRAYSYYEEKDYYYIITEYIKNGNLYLKILQNDGLEEKEAFKYFSQVIKAVEFLHENNLIHRDIKPENILLDKKDKIKLCDFGSCSDIKNGFRETFCGTFEYMAPEMIKELPYNQGVDIWSLGVLLYEMIHGFSPFFNKSEDKTQKRDLSQIFKNILTNKLEFKAGLSLLQVDKKTRIRTFEIKEHEWFKIFEENSIQKLEDIINMNKSSIIDRCAMENKRTDSADLDIYLKDFNKKKSNNKAKNENKLYNDYSSNVSKDIKEKEVKLISIRNNIANKKSLKFNVIPPNLYEINGEKDIMSVIGKLNSSINFDENKPENTLKQKLKIKEKEKEKEKITKEENSHKILDTNSIFDIDNQSNLDFDDFNLLNTNENLPFTETPKDANYDMKVEDELFDKVLDNIKYRKKKKPTNLNIKELENNVNNMNLLSHNTCTSDDVSNERNSNLFRNKDSKNSHDPLKSRISTQGESRISDNNNKFPNKNLKSFKEILNEDLLNPRKTNSINNEDIEENEENYLENFSVFQQEENSNNKMKDEIKSNKLISFDFSGNGNANKHFNENEIRKSKHSVKMNQRINSTKSISNANIIGRNSKGKFSYENNNDELALVKDNSGNLVDKNKRNFELKSFKKIKNDLKNNNNENMFKMGNNNNTIERKYRNKITIANKDSSKNHYKSISNLSEDLFEKKKEMVNTIDVDNNNYYNNEHTPKGKIDNDKPKRYSFDDYDETPSGESKVNKISIKEEYQSNIINQNKTLAILKSARNKNNIKKANKTIDIETEPDFWDKVGGFFGIFKCASDK